MNPDELNRLYGIDKALVFQAGPGGLVQAKISAAGGQATVLLHGAHVTSFQPTGGQPVLWMSGRSWFADGKPVRGGVPVCFPWFGTNGPRPDSPQHGFARLMSWQVQSARRLEDGRVCLRLALSSGEPTKPYWPGDFQASYAVTVGGELTMALEARNSGAEPFTITQALHSYFAVSDVRSIVVRGLEHTEYLDRGPGAAAPTANQGDQPIRFSGETDRAYVNTAATCVLEDPGMGRRIVVAKSGSASTVVWNPWMEKARRMPDFGEEEWPGMVCIETANVPANAVTLAPGAAHSLQARIAVAGMGA